MDKAALVDNNIQAGRRLIEALDRSSFTVKAALWFYISESNEWRFILASPYVDQNGMQKSYKYIQNIMARNDPPIDISLKDISVVSNRHEMISQITRAIQVTPGGIASMRVSGTVFNGVFIESAYIYRLSR